MRIFLLLAGLGFLVLTAPARADDETELVRRALALHQEGKNQEAIELLRPSIGAPGQYAGVEAQMLGSLAAVGAVKHSEILDDQVVGGRLRRIYVVLECARGPLIGAYTWRKPEDAWRYDGYNYIGVGAFSRFADMGARKVDEKIPVLEQILEMHRTGKHVEAWEQIKTEMRAIDANPTQLDQASAQITSILKALTPLTSIDKVEDEQLGTYVRRVGFLFSSTKGAMLVVYLFDRPDKDWRLIAASYGINFPQIALRTQFSGTTSMQKK
ncbi:hypothetical protein [Roseiterribacter gracilis]|uniref:DUF2066 domain-containing protein n=1 Tax=Roseiterribacter gracilis TaxID=2812848 RepID=A0A8S8XBF8_9PROT|nr:hypothetical protein TMPK1_07330 [Rhodospirillales bacterium TMPK1]